MGEELNGSGNNARDPLSICLGKWFIQDRFEIFHLSLVIVESL